jgi:hypothetical protein
MLQPAKTKLRLGSTIDEVNLLAFIEIREEDETG